MMLNPFPSPENGADEFHTLLKLLNVSVNCSLHRLELLALLPHTLLLHAQRIHRALNRIQVQ